MKPVFNAFEAGKYCFQAGHTLATGLAQPRPKDDPWTPRYKKLFMLGFWAAGGTESPSDSDREDSLR